MAFPSDQDEKPNYRFATKAIHAGCDINPLNGALMTPIYMNSTYAQKSPGEPISKYEYSRTANPTRDAFEANLAALENGQYGLSFASGCAAFSTLLHTLPRGSHIVLNDDIYGGTHRLIAQVYAEQGLTYSQCDLSDPTAIKQAITKKTKLIWIETPSNPLLKITDIRAISEYKMQHAKDVLFAVDNTFATPYLQNPLNLGADIVSHSTTKYIGGHSDVIGGALILNDKALAEKLAYLQNAIGAVPSPMDCFLLLRSTKTLHVRMNAHCRNAKLIAECLRTHAKIKKVIYPGLKEHPQHELATKQMRDYGGMISVVLEGDGECVKRFLSKLKLFTLAESLGGVESLIEHPASMTHAAIPAAHRKQIGIEESLVRISVGIEDPNDLITDLQEALKD